MPLPPTVVVDGSMKAVILAGGQGKRLKPLTDTTPKPLVEVAGKPIAVHQIEWLKQYGIREFIFTVGHLKEKIIDALGNGAKYNVKIYYSVEDEPLGTGGAIKRLESLLSEPFIAVNGDVLTDIDPTKLIEASDDENIVGVIAAVPLPSPYGIIYSDSQDYITQFKEKPQLTDYWINAGVYYLKPKIFEHLPEFGDIELVFWKIGGSRKLKVVKYPYFGFWKSIDTFKDVEEAERLLWKSIKDSERRR